MSSLAVVEQNKKLVIDSRLIAEDLGIQHKNFLATIDKYKNDVEKKCGAIAVNSREFKTKRGNRAQGRQAWLTECQLKALLARCRTGLSEKMINDLADFGWDLSAFSAQKVKRAKRKENSYRNDLALELGGKKEVTTLAGNIDILTSQEVIEVKAVHCWKSALGQVLVYGDYYPSHKKRIHLFGETQESYLEVIRKHCKKRNVFVTWEP